MSSPGANRRGIIALLVATFFFTINDAIAKIVIRSLPIGEMIFIRGLMTIAFLVLALAVMGHLGSLRQLFSRSVAGRSFFDACATVFFVNALGRMHLSDLISIILASPLILTAMSVLLYKEQVGWRRWSAIVVGLIGTMFIVKPGLGSMDAWALLGFASAFASASRDLLTQRLDHKIPAVAIGVAASVAISIGGVVLGINEQWRMPTSNEIGMLTMSAAFYSVASYLLVLAFRGVELSVVSPFRYALLFWALIAGYILLGEVPDGWSIVGALIIVGSGLYTLHREAVRRRNLTGDTPPQ